MALFIGTAGWSIPRSEAHAFAGEGTALQRYASRLGAVEINSSFHRPHRPATWAKWASLVPSQFRFAVKVPKTITHECKLADCDGLLAAFCDDVTLLGPKLAVLLVQLPPKLAFQPEVAERFFSTLRTLTPARLACEPRHASWFDAEADRLLSDAAIARVAADPAPVAQASSPGGSKGLAYWRLHGSPRMYRSPYGPQRLAEYSALIASQSAAGAETWVMFDNTASSAAISDALLLEAMIAAEAGARGAL